MQANACRAPLTIVSEPLLGYPISLSGEHQKWNAALALAALHAAGIPLRFDVVHYGLSHTQWPGRFEIMARDSATIILDGAHNPHAAQVLAHTWQQHYPLRRAALIFSAVCSKDVTGVLALLAPLVEKIFLCPVNSPRSLTTAQLRDSLPHGAPETAEFPDFLSALTAATRDYDLLLIAGSLYLIGQARAELLGGNFQSSAQ